MIKEFVKAWNVNKDELITYFTENIPSDYEDIFKALVVKVINPYLLDELNSAIDYPLSEGLNEKAITKIDDGDYQGTQLFIIPCANYQPDMGDYYVTSVWYGSCSGCDTFEGIVDDYDLYKDKITETNRKKAAKQFQTLALHMLQQMRCLVPDEEETDEQDR